MASHSDSASSRVPAEKESIVVPAAAVPSTGICLRSLSPLGVHTIVVSEDPFAMSFSSKYCDEAVLVPDPTTDLEMYSKALLALARREDVRTIVPVREEDAFVLSKHREAFAEYISTPWPNMEALQRVHDRVRLAAAAETAGVPVPKTTPLEAVETWDSPSIIKSRYNLLVNEYVDTVPQGETDRNKTVKHVQTGEVVSVDELRTTFGHNPIVQEFISTDEEYMFAALCDHGEPLSTFHHEQIRAPSYTGGGGVYRESTYLPKLEDTALALLEELEWHGLACIEYMRHPETGDFYLTEINPRMWTSLSANVQMGANFPKYYWQMAMNRTNKINSNYERGVGCHYFKGELMHVLSLLGEDSALVERPSLMETLYKILLSCYRQQNFDVFSRDDPWPFIQDILTEIDGATPTSFELVELGRRASRSDRPTHWRKAADTPETKDDRHQLRLSAGLPSQH